MYICCMTVLQLIEELTVLPPNAEVMHLWDGELRTCINVVYLAKNGDVVTADYREVCYTTECRPVNAPSSEENQFWHTEERPKFPNDINLGN